MAKAHPTHLTLDLRSRTFAPAMEAEVSPPIITSHAPAWDPGKLAVATVADSGLPGIKLLSIRAQLARIPTATDVCDQPHPEVWFLEPSMHSGVTLLAKTSYGWRFPAIRLGVVLRCESECRHASHRKVHNVILASMETDLPLSAAVVLNFSLNDLYPKSRSKSSSPWVSSLVAAA